MHLEVGGIMSCLQRYQHVHDTQRVTEQQCLKELPVINELHCPAVALFCSVRHQEALAFLKIPWLCSIPRPWPANTNTAPGAEARLAEATAWEGLQPSEPRRVLGCEKIPQNSPHHFIWKCVREEAGNQQWNTAALYWEEKAFLTTQVACPQVPLSEQQGATGRLESPGWQ